MQKIVSQFQKYLTPFFNTRAGGLYILLFAISIGTATFIENDYGTSSAQKVVYQTNWFEILLLLFSITLVVNIVKFRMVPQKRWALVTLHLSMIVILIGSALTRYIGSEGMMHIREDDTSNTFLSSESHLLFEAVSNGQTYKFDKKVLFATLGKNKFKESYLIDDKLIKVKLTDFIPNPLQVLKESGDGKAHIKIVLAGANGREEYFLGNGDVGRYGSSLYNFGDDYMPGAINIKFEDNNLYIKADKTLTQLNMTSQVMDTLIPADNYYPLQLRALYSQGPTNFVFAEFQDKSMTALVSSAPRIKNESVSAVALDIDLNGDSHRTILYGQKGVQGRPVFVENENIKLGISYGAKPITLPFYLKLHKFIMERYPGTNSAASYASEVQLIDNRSEYKEDHRIYMNHILNYGGYRFFQSSFDKDEKGTYLSVNHDFWGTLFSYIGYGLLTLGMIFSFFSKKSRFYKLSKMISNLRVNQASIILLLCLFVPSFYANAQNSSEAIQINNIIDETHAERFSRIIVQDHKGRMKPIHTLSRELMRKMVRKEKMYGLTSDQIILSMLVDSKEWAGVPLIKSGKHETLIKLIGSKSDHVSYNTFFTPEGEYILREEVRRVYDLQPIDRGVLEKEIIKIDERVNIANLVFSGRIFKIIPVVGDSLNTWVSSLPIDHQGNRIRNELSERFFTAYPQSLHQSFTTGDYSSPNQILDELSNFQQSRGGSVALSNMKINAEIFLNNLNVFGKLSVWYLLLGLGFLSLLFLSIFKPGLNLKAPFYILFSAMILAFLFHTLGLGLRWYVSGRAPWSNGYESMIYIAWTSCLAGLIFTRKSFGGLAATTVLAATVLLVATLSYLDPEITPLVPVLRSYWLTIHVSLVAGSYGFLMLGAIIGLINLILMMFLSEKNKIRIFRVTKEMSYISEMTLIGGLVMIAVGTYLGGVWANESWGRYWGWDAKETWALVTILVYAFILHIRIIPKLNGIYIFNLLTIFGWASVIMTYYGVNYYLSGLHSYATGDPAPLPSWVFIMIIIIFTISVIAYWRKRKYKEFNTTNF